MGPSPRMTDRSPYPPPPDVRRQPSPRQTQEENYRMYGHPGGPGPLGPLPPPTGPPGPLPGQYHPDPRGHPPPGYPYDRRYDGPPPHMQGPPPPHNGAGPGPGPMPIPGPGHAHGPGPAGPGMLPREPTPLNGHRHPSISSAYNEDQRGHSPAASIASQSKRKKEDEASANSSGSAKKKAVKKNSVDKKSTLKVTLKTGAASSTGDGEGNGEASSPPRSTAGDATPSRAQGPNRTVDEGECCRPRALARG